MSSHLAILLLLALPPPLAPQIDLLSLELDLELVAGFALAASRLELRALPPTAGLTCAQLFAAPGPTDCGSVPGLQAPGVHTIPLGAGLQLAPEQAVAGGASVFGIALVYAGEGVAADGLRLEPVTCEHGLSLSYGLAP